MGLDRSGHHHWRSVGGKACVLHQQLQVSAVNHATAVGVQRLAVTGITAHRACCGGDLHRVGAIGLAVAVGIAGHEKAQRVAARSHAGNVDALQAGVIELVQDEGTVALYGGGHRSEARHHGN